MPLIVKLAFAGLGSLIWHWGIGAGIIILILVAEYFTVAIGSAVPLLGKFLERFRKDLLWVALGIGLVLVGEYIGAKDMAGRCEAKSVVIENTVTKAVTGAKEKPGLDRWDTDK